MKQEITQETIELIVKVKINYSDKKEREEAIEIAKECCVYRSTFAGNAGCIPESAKLFTPELKIGDMVEVSATEFIENLKSTPNFNAKNVKIKVKDGFVNIEEISTKTEDVSPQFKIGNIVELVSMIDEQEDYKWYLGMRGEVENVLGTTARIRLENNSLLTPYLKNLKLITSSNNDAIKFGEFLLDNNYKIYQYGNERYWSDGKSFSLSTVDAYNIFKNPPPSQLTPEELKRKEAETKVFEYIKSTGKSHTVHEANIIVDYIIKTL